LAQGKEDAYVRTREALEKVPVLVSVSGEVVSGNNGTHFDPMPGQTENQRCAGQKMRKRAVLLLTLTLALTLLQRASSE
jgi:hypothetical protein